MYEVCKRAMLVAGFMAVAFALPARAQLQIGDEVSMKASGNVSFGYTANYSNLTPSDHTLTPSGNADLNGYYYSPGFISFDVSPFYNESRNNSSYQSIFQSSGVNGTASIFSGSHFPGTISYSKIYNSEGGLSIPGIGNLTTKGNSDNLAVGWGIHIPDLPSVSFQFLDGDNSSTVFGTTQPSTFNAKTFGTQVTDTVAGFSLSGGYQYNKVHSLTPEFLAGEGPLLSNSTDNSINFGAGHKLPLRGSASVSYSRSEFSSEDGTSADAYSGTIDTINSGAGFEPIRNLEVGVNAQYTNNLTGMLYQSYINAGVVVPASALNYSTNSLDFNGHGNYILPSIHLTFSANADHREQNVLGTELSANTYNEMATYGNDFLGGFINATSGITQSTVSINTGSSSLGLFDTVSYQRIVREWSLTGSLNYSRNTQTVLIGYTTSGRGYSASIGRKINPYTYWSFSAVGTKSSFNDEPNSGSDSTSYATSLTLRRMSFSGSYGKADGISILTATGLTPVSTTTPIFSPLQPIVFNGKSYSFAASAVPIRGMVLSATYSKSRSETLANAASSSNSTAQLNTMLQYKLRQLWITGGYLKLQQGFSITGQPYASYSSFYMGITRWFNFF